MSDDQSSRPAGFGDNFDRARGALEGLPDVTHSKPSTITASTVLVGDVQTFIVQTFRQAEVGDTIFLQCISAQGSLRLAIPPKVAEAIARQRDSIVSKNRSKAGKRVAEERKARGEVPAFQRAKTKLREFDRTGHVSLTLEEADAVVREGKKRRKKKRGVRKAAKR